MEINITTEQAIDLGRRYGARIFELEMQVEGLVAMIAERDGLIDALTKSLQDATEATGQMVSSLGAEEPATGVLPASEEVPEGIHAAAAKASSSKARGPRARMDS